MNTQTLTASLFSLSLLAVSAASAPVAAQTTPAASPVAQMGANAGDAVSLELSPYDLTRGRIVYRYK